MNTDRYDPVLAREAAFARNPVKASRQDWDAIDWEAAHLAGSQQGVGRGSAGSRQIARRRKMVNQDWDKEWDRPEYHDPALALLEQRAYIEQVQLRPEEWVEETLELYERNCEKAKVQRLPDQERWAKEKERMRLVNILHPTQVMRKLRAAGVDARDHESPYARIWLNDWTVNGLVGVNAWVEPEPMDEEGYLAAMHYVSSQKQADILTANFMGCHFGRKIQRTLTSLQEPYGPEWSIMRFNDHQVAYKEKYRGWRTAMLVLIVAGILTEQEVDCAFGAPIGEAGAWYRAQLKIWRQIRQGG